MVLREELLRVQELLLEIAVRGAHITLEPTVLVDALWTMP
jgi:hypothetical protein